MNTDLCVCFHLVWLLLMMINSPDLFLWKVHYIWSTYESLLYVFPLLLFSFLSFTYFFLPISHIISAVITLPITAQANALTPACLCMCVYLRVICLKSLNILKTEAYFNYTLITLLITCHTHIHHWPHSPSTHSDSYTYTHTLLCLCEEFLTYW